MNRPCFVDDSCPSNASSIYPLRLNVCQSRFSALSCVALHSVPHVRVAHTQHHGRYRFRHPRRRPRGARRRPQGFRHAHRARGQGKTRGLTSGSHHDRRHTAGHLLFTRSSEPKGSKRATSAGDACVTSIPPPNTHTRHNANPYAPSLPLHPRHHPRFSVSFPLCFSPQSHKIFHSPLASPPLPSPATAT